MNANAPRWGRRATAALLLAVGLAASSCATSATTGTDAAPTTVPQDGGTLVMAVDQETDGWSPTVSQWTNAGYWVGSTVIEPLATYDEHGETVMWLADSIVPTVPGQLDSWTIRVKPGITFHNGEKLDAAAVKANLDPLADGRSLAAVALGDKFKAITIVDDLSVRVDVNGPWADFPAMMTGPPGMMVAQEMINEPLGGLARPIGTGPFVFESWTPHVSFKATRNANYWRPGEPHLDSIEFRPMVDNKEAVAALRRGDVDMILTTKAGDVALAGDDMVARTDFKSEKTVMITNTAQSPTMQNNPLRNEHARRAVAYATDRAALRALVGGGDIETSTQVMVADTPWEIPESETGYVEFDQDRARAEIDAYRRETGEQTIVFEMQTIEAPDDIAIAQTIADQLAEVGITMRVSPRKTQELVLNTVMGNFHAVIQRNYGYPNPDTMLPLLASDNANGPGQLSVNFAQHRDPEIDAAIAGIASTTDRSAQRDHYRTLTRRLNQAAVNQWLYDTPYAVIHSTDINGTETLTTHKFGNMLPKPWFWVSVWRS